VISDAEEVGLTWPHILPTMSTTEPGLTIETHDRAGWKVVVVEGEIDLSTAPTLRLTLGAEADAGVNRIAVDLRSVGFMDSMGLGVLIGARRRLTERDGDLALICVGGPVRRVLDVSGLADIFLIVASDEALPPP
jgi:anti-sigma B factor antagonist